MKSLDLVLKGLRKSYDAFIQRELANFAPILEIVLVLPLTSPKPKTQNESHQRSPVHNPQSIAPSHQPFDPSNVPCPPLLQSHPLPFYPSIPIPILTLYNLYHPYPLLENVLHTTLSYTIKPHQALIHHYSGKHTYKGCVAFLSKPKECRYF